MSGPAIFGQGGSTSSQQLVLGVFLQVLVVSATGAP